MCREQCALNSDRETKSAGAPENIGYLYCLHENNPTLECQQNVVSSSRMPEVLKVEEDTKYLDLSLRKHKSCEELRAEGN